MRGGVQLWRNARRKKGLSSQKKRKKKPLNNIHLLRKSVTRKGRP